MRIIGIEGAGDFNVIKNSLAFPMLERFNFTYQHCEWQDWQQYAMLPWDAVIGHSLGGDSAVRLCNWQKKNNKPQPKLLMTLAARYQADVKAASWLDLFWPYDPMQEMTAPIYPTHNFWTYGPLPSAPMKGAFENVCVSPWYWHGNVPSAPAVQNCLNDFLTKARQSGQL